MARAVAAAPTSDESTRVEWVAPERLAELAIHPSMLRRIRPNRAAVPNTCPITSPECRPRATKSRPRRDRIANARQTSGRRALETTKPHVGIRFLTCGFSGGAGDRDRTGMTSLEGWGSAIELHPRGTPVGAGAAGR